MAQEVQSIFFDDCGLLFWPLPCFDPDWGPWMSKTAYGPKIKGFLRLPENRAALISQTLALGRRLWKSPACQKNITQPAKFVIALAVGALLPMPMGQNTLSKFSYAHESWLPHDDSFQNNCE